MKEQILIVDDEAMVLQMQRRVFAREGFACRTAGSAEAAMAILREGGIALALIDINMPGRSGVQLLQKMRELCPDVAVIMVTAVDDLETALACLRLGAEDYLVKPFAVDRLILSVRNALEKRRLRLENRNYQLQLEERVREQTQQITYCPGRAAAHL